MSIKIQADFIANNLRANTKKTSPIRLKRTVFIAPLLDKEERYPATNKYEVIPKISHPKIKRRKSAEEIRIPIPITNPIRTVQNSGFCLSEPT
jgi:hypothetical protein